MTSITIVVKPLVTDESTQMKLFPFSIPNALNFRDLGGLPTTDGILPEGLFFRCAKLSLLSKKTCQSLLKKHHIQCVIDLRTPVEAEEFPDPLSKDIEYLQIPLFKDSTIGVTRESGSDPVAIIKKLKDDPEKLREMVPDMPKLYKLMVTDEYSRSQLDKVVAILLENAEQRKATLFHCTAGKDRTGIVAMALLKHLGASDETIINDYLRTNRSTIIPTLKQCIGVFLITHRLQCSKILYRAFMADSELIKIAIRHLQ